MRFGDAQSAASGSHTLAAETSVIRSDIQALRGVAVLAVVIYHSGLGLSGGYVGVDVFFVISGFVIARGLLRELEASGTISLRRFYARRIRRLMPSLAVVTIATLALSALFLGFAVQEVASRTALAATFFSANVFLYRSGGGYFAPADESNPFLHTWSLSVEEQFYVVLPACLVLLSTATRTFRPRNARRLVLTVLASAAMVSLLASWALSGGWGDVAQRIPAAERFAFYLPVARAWEFLVGVLLAFVPLAWTPGRHTSVVLRAAGIGTLAWAVVSFDSDTHFPGIAAAAPVFATAALIASGAGHREVRRSTTSAVHRVTARLSSVLVRAGDNSYSWYLWHWPFIVLAGSIWSRHTAVLTLAATASLVPAVASRRLVEDPIRFRWPSGRRHLAALAAACLLVPAVSALVVQEGARSDWGLTTPAGWEEQRLAVELGCVDTPEPAWPAQRCSITAQDDHGTVLLIGDSHAASASDGVAAAARVSGMSFGVWAMSGCPALLGRSPVDHPPCPEWQAELLTAIDDLEPDVVVIANRSSGYTRVEENDWRIIGAEDGSEPADRDQAIASWTAGLDALLGHLTRRGIGVVVLANVPEYPDAVDGFPMTVFRAAEPPPSIASSHVDRERGPVLRAEADTVSRHPGTEFLDPASVLCDGQVCRAGDGDTWWYMDGHHLNPTGSRLLTPSVAAALQRLQPSGR